MKAAGTSWWQGIHHPCILLTMITIVSVILLLYTAGTSVHFHVIISNTKSDTNDSVCSESIVPDELNPKKHELEKKPENVKEVNASRGYNLDVKNYRSTVSTSTESPISINLQKERSRIVYSATKAVFDVKAYADFSPCEYKDCVLKFGERIEDMKDADVLLFEYDKIPSPLADNSPERANQLWLIYALESPAYGHNKWNPALVNNRFNLTATYRRDSDIPIPYYKAVKLKEEKPTRMIDYSAGKTKGAFAYVSNCKSSGYDRLNLMRQLKKYIDVDIYGGCTDSHPCRDSTCEKNLHKQYRFYLSFENSLCKDYITEKFWGRLSSSDILLPVAMGGLSLDEYVEVAPPDSFLHVYNFSSIDTLGEYLRHLMVNNNAYNGYHSWRQHYKTEEFNFCKVCELAHKNYQQRAYDDLANWWNKDTCKA